jgi:hypothetical protein
MTLKKYGIFGMAALVILVLSFFILPQISEAAVTDWQRGASIYTIKSNDFVSSDFKESLKVWKGTGANYISLVIPYHQKDKFSSEVFAGADTPSDQVLTEAIEYAHSIGLKVMLKPHLGPDDGAWRALIDAADRKAWFVSYGNMLNHLADIAEKTGAEEICIGTELITMASETTYPDNTAEWNILIQNMRARYNGFLTYSANWGGSDFMEEVAHVGFWDKLDFIGISAYYPLASEKWNPKVNDFLSSWKYWDQTKIKPLYDKHKKPILFTEVGYRSVPGANAAPYDGTEKSGIDVELQANLYEALHQYWDSKPYMAGIHMWDWKLDPLEGGAGNNQYTPRFKPAEEVFKQWYATSTKIVKASVTKNTSKNISQNTPKKNYSVVGEHTVLNLTDTTTLKRGIHQFRANLLNRPNYTYVTSWQVDGGEYHWMSDNQQTHIQEQDLVDVSGWWWKGAGPYRITFISREFGGKILAQRSIDLYLRP